MSPLPFISSILVSKNAMIVHRILLRAHNWLAAPCGESAGMQQWGHYSVLTVHSAEKGLEP